MDSLVHIVDEGSNAYLYSTLDLREFEVGFSESPRVLSIMASLIDRVVQRN